MGKMPMLEERFDLRFNIQAKEALVMTRLSYIGVMAALLFASPLAVAQEAPEEMQGTVHVGDKAPGFTLKDQNGEERSLESLLNEDGYVALVFHRSAHW